MIVAENIAQRVDKLGNGPLHTRVYKGTFGVVSSKFSYHAPFSLFACSCLGYESEFNSKSRAIIKKIETKVIKYDINWSILRNLEHPNLARHLLVHTERRLFSANVLYIVQNYAEHTFLSYQETISKKPEYHFVVLRNAVEHIASGLSHLHSNGISHGNLKPSNVFVKPPLKSPVFILTDYAYSNCRFYKKRDYLSFFRSRATQKDDPEITKWLAPEVIAGTQLSGSGENADKILDLAKSADVYSFGKILEWFRPNMTSLDLVDTILRRLLMEQMTMSSPGDRITCDKVLKSHPFLVARLECDARSCTIAESRMGMIKKFYDMVEKDARNKIDSFVEPVTKRFFPWTEKRFGKNMSEAMTKICKVKNLKAKKYKGDSLMELLRLIRNTKEHPLINNDLQEKVDEDAFSKNYPFALPIIYVCVECEHISEHLIRFLSTLHKQVSLRMKCTS